jgi:[ribosomal protein S5]-alanine N-acetyltransferase
LARNLQEQQCKLRAKPYGRGFAGQANVSRTRFARKLVVDKKYKERHVNSIIIKTERLYMEKLKQEDAQTVFLYRSNDTVSMYQTFHPKTLQDVIEFIKSNTKHIDIDDSWFQLGIYLLSGKLIGDFGIHFIDNKTGICEIGYTINPDNQRKGYGKEATLGVLNYLFGIMKKNEIIASIDPRNEPSKRMIEGMGFEIKEQKPDDIEYVLSRKKFRLTTAST